MKTSINSFIAIALTATVLSTSAFVSSASASTKPVSETVAAAKNFKRISVKGNVELVIVQSGDEGVSFASNNKGTAYVTQYGDLLTISSTSKETVKLVVNVSDLYRIQASDNAVVKTDGKLQAKYLQIFLSGEAIAEIKSNTESIYTVSDDFSTLKLTGTSKNHIVSNSATSVLYTNEFTAQNTEESTPKVSAIDYAIAQLAK
ncbi:GIN domain-containing protein [Pedobacter sp. MW01-1-1]|uniref:GIN domain-containing protein n=1 Tax=Pedobacter sp. MW01-1-1 TaxID=3383027 RepID=UPI003FEF63E2